MAKTNGNRYKKNLRGLKMAKANDNRYKKNLRGLKMAKANVNRYKKNKLIQILQDTQNQQFFKLKC